jgi:TP901 family phage tail tape measure protein
MGKPINIPIVIRADGTEAERELGSFFNRVEKRADRFGAKLKNAFGFSAADLKNIEAVSKQMSGFGGGSSSRMAAAHIREFKLIEKEFARSSKEVQRIEREQVRSSESLQRQRSAAIISQYKAEEREAARSAKAKTQIAEQHADLLGGISKRIMLAAGAAVAAAGYLVVRYIEDATEASAKLHQAVANIATIKPEIDTSRVFKALREMQTRVPQTAEQLADSLYDTFSSINVTEAEGLKLVESFARGATAAVTDAKSFGTAVVGVLNAYGKSVEEVGHIQDVFFNTVKNGVVTGAELAGNLGLVTQSAKNAGVNVDELGALIAGVTKEGGKAEQNINNLANVFLKLPTKETRKGLHDVGVELIDLRTGKFRPIIEVLTDLKVKLDKLPPAVRAVKLNEIFRDQQARTGLSTALSQLDFIKESLQENVTAAGAADAAYETMAGTYATAAALQEGATRNLKLAIGDIITQNPYYIEAIKIVTEQLNDQTASLSDASSETAKFATNAGTMYSKILAYAIPFTAYMMNNVKLLIGVLLVGIGSVIGGTLFMVEQFLNGINFVVNTAIDRLKMAYNGAQDILNKIGAGTAHRFEMGVTVTPHVNLGSASVFNEVGKTSDQMSQLVEVQRRLEAEGVKIDERFDRVEKITKLRAGDDRRARGDVNNVGRGMTEYKIGAGGFLIPGAVRPGDGTLPVTIVKDKTDAVALSKANAEAALKAAMDGKGKTHRAKLTSSDREDNEFLNSIARNIKAPRPADQVLAGMISNMAAQINMPQGMAFAQLHAESSFNPKARSEQGALGLGQIMPGTGARYGYSPKELLDPKKNLSAWGQYMTFLFNRFGDWDLAILAYHQGEGTVDKLVKVLTTTGGGKADVQKAARASGIIGPKGRAYLRDIKRFDPENASGKDVPFNKDLAEGLSQLMLGLTPEQYKASSKQFLQSGHREGTAASFRALVGRQPLTTEAGQLATTITRKPTLDDTYRQEIDNRYLGPGGEYEKMIMRRRNLDKEVEATERDSYIERENMDIDYVGNIAKAEGTLRNLRMTAADDQLTEQRHLLQTKTEEIDLTQRLQSLQDEFSTSGANVGLRRQIALQEELNAIKREDLEVTERQARAQVRLADQTVYHAGRANEKVLEYLASQKGITDIVADAKIGIIEETFNGVDSVLDRIIPKMHGFGSIIKNIIADLIKLEASRFLMRILGVGTNSSAPAQQQNSTGSGTSWKNIIGSLFKGGGRGQSDEEEDGGGSPLGGGYGGIIKNFKSNGFVGGLKGLIGLGGSGGGAAALGASAPVSAAGSWATAAGGAGALAGGAGAAGAGAAGAGGAAAGGSSGLGALVPFLTNPWTIGIAAAAVGGILLWKHFRNTDEKKLRKAIKAAYGVDIKDMKVLSQIKQMGEQAFGKGAVGRRLQDVIKLDGVKSLVQQYAESTGQQANGLTTNAQYADPNFKENQFARGSGSSSSFSNTPYQVTMPRSGDDTSGGGSSGGNSSSGVKSNGIAPVLMAAFTGALQNVTEVVGALHDKLQATSLDDVFTAGARKNPEAVIDGLNEGLSRGHRRDDTLSNLGFRNGG